MLTPWPGDAGRLEESNRETIAELAGVEVMTLDEIDLASRRRAGRASACV